MAGEAELLAADEDLARVREAAQDRRHGFVPCRHEELVDVDVGQPLGRRAEEAQRVVVGVALEATHREAHERHEAAVQVALEQALDAIGAAVVIEEEVLHADRDVMAEPLLDVRSTRSS